jgi:hypothetical protein
MKAEGTVGAPTCLSALYTNVYRPFAEDFSQFSTLVYYKLCDS